MTVIAPVSVSKLIILNNKGGGQITKITSEVRPLPYYVVATIYGIFLSLSLSARITFLPEGVILGFWNFANCLEEA